MKPSDVELLTATDADSFGVFYQRHAAPVLGYLRRRTNDPELAADLCAEVFAAALMARRRFEHYEGDVSRWLFRVAGNKLADALRRGYAQQRAHERLRLERHDAEDEATDCEGGEVISLLDRLTPEQRDAVRARVLHGFDYEVIGRRQGVSEAVARKRVSRGLGSLRAALEAAA